MPIFFLLTRTCTPSVFCTCVCCSSPFLSFSYTLSLPGIRFLRPLEAQCPSARLLAVGGYVIDFFRFSLVSEATSGLLSVLPSRAAFPSYCPSLKERVIASPRSHLPSFLSFPPFLNKSQLDTKIEIASYISTTTTTSRLHSHTKSQRETTTDSTREAMASTISLWTGSLATDTSSFPDGAYFAQFKDLIFMTEYVHRPYAQLLGLLLTYSLRWYFLPEGVADVYARFQDALAKQKMVGILSFPTPRRPQPEHSCLLDGQYGCKHPSVYCLLTAFTIAR